TPASLLTSPNQNSPPSTKTRLRRALSSTSAISCSEGGSGDEHPARRAKSSNSLTIVINLNSRFPNIRRSPKFDKLKTDLNEQGQPDWRLYPSTLACKGYSGSCCSR